MMCWSTRAMLLVVLMVGDKDSISGGNFVIKEKTFVFNVVHSTAVIDDRLRMSFGGNLVIMRK